MVAAVPSCGHWARPPTRVAHVWQKCTDPAAPLHLVHRRPLRPYRAASGRAVPAGSAAAVTARVRIYG